MSDVRRFELADWSGKPHRASPVSSFLLLVLSVFLSFFLANCTNHDPPAIIVIFNRSLSTGVVPSAFKMANVTPMLKDMKGHCMAPTNYRGISLTPILSKVLEQIGSVQLEEHFDNHRQPLCYCQYGFRAKRSTTH